jgi:hypothetical protein
MLKILKDIVKHQVKGHDAMTEIARKTDEIYWSAVFNSAIADSRWFLNKSLNPGRWAASYPFLYILYRVYNEIKPKNILEFGLGETSKLAYQYKEAFPEADLTIIEQDENWLKFFSANIHNVVPNTIVLDIEHRTVNGFTTKTYNGLLEKIGGRKFDLVLVDGPWGSDHFSRYQIVDIVENNLLAEQFIIIIDDCHRVGEKETARKVKDILKLQGVKFAEGMYSGVKDTLLICSENYKFLTSL